MAPHLLQHMQWNEPCVTVCTGRTPETKTPVNKGTRPIEFIKVMYTCSKQLGNLMCMETEMFRVTMSEINKQNKLPASSHYSLLGPCQLLSPCSPSTHFLDHWRFMPDWMVKDYIIPAATGKRWSRSCRKVWELG